MGKEENKKYIPVVRDRESGSYAFRGPGNQAETIKNIRTLKRLGIRERDIDIIPVKEPRTDKFLRGLQIAGIICTIIDFGIFLAKYHKEKKEKKLGKHSTGVDR